MSQYDGERYYHGIPGLLVPRTGHTYEKMHAEINRFIDTIPSMVESMEDNLATIVSI